MFPILGAEYPAKPKAGAAADAALIACEPRRFGVLCIFGSPGAFERFGSLNLFMFNPLRDCSIGFAIAEYALGGAEAGSVPRLRGLAAVLTACNSAGSFIGATCVAAGALENGSLKEYEGVVAAVAEVIAALGDAPLIM